MNDPPDSRTFTGISIQVSPALTGSKRAVQFGDGPIVVSPAMYDLIRHADGGELRRLLESIELLRLPAMPSKYEYVPMLTQPPPDAIGVWAGIRTRLFGGER